MVDGKISGYFLLGQNPAVGSAHGRQQRLGLAKIGGLSGRQRQGDRIAESIDDDVDLGGQSASGASDGLLAVFFRAPALC